MRNSEYQAVNIKNDIPELVHELTVFSDTYPIRILGAQAVRSDFEAFRLSAVIENIHTAQELVSEIRAHKYDANKFSSRILSAINKKQQMNENEFEFVSAVDLVVEKELKDLDNSFEFQKSQVTTWLNVERMMLVAAVKSSQISFTNYFDSATPKYLSALKQSSEFSDSWLGWLESGATNEQLLNFFQWYLYSVVESQNSPEVKELFEETHNDFIGKVELGVADGWLSGNVDIESVAQPVEIYINTPFENMIHDSVANYEIEKDLIKLSPLWQWSNSNEQTKFLFTHELIHARLDSLFNENEVLGRSSGAFEESWFREAVTEHINTVLRSGHPEIFNPNNEYRGGTYEGWRMIVNAILEKGDEKINPKLITRAMSGSQSEKNVFYEAVDKSWGVDDCLGLISRFIDIKTREFTKGFLNVNYFNQVESVSYDTYEALTNTPELIFGYSEKTLR